MKILKTVAIVAIVSFCAPLITSADTTTPTTTGEISTIKATLQTYEDRIKALEIDNKKLWDEINALKAAKTTTSPIVVVPVTPATTTPTSDSGTPTPIQTGTGKYDKLIENVNGMMTELLSSHGIDPKATIGMYEFIEPDAFFVSIDDGKNETGVTAFPFKVLYKYDKNLTITQIGFFKLDQRVQLYVTVSGSNPYAKATRIRVKNPAYKGKLLDEVSTSTTATTTTTKPTPVTTTTTTTTTTPTNVTYADIKKAYDKNDILGALKLSNDFIAKNPDNADVLRIRYRGFYIVGKYADSLDAIAKLETLKPTDFNKLIACDAIVIAKYGKRADLQKYYTGLCQK